MSHPAYGNYKQTIKNEIREIPSHWDLVRLKNILQRKITDGPHSTPEFVDSGIPFLSVDSIQDGELKFENCRYISVDDHLEFSKKAKPALNDILLAKAASTGKVARVKSDIEFNIWSPLALIRILQSAADPAFVEFVLKSTTTQVQIENLCTSNTQKNISMDDIPKVFFALPPIAEQKVIADFLEHETVKIDNLITEQECLIELLKEKRQAVISHLVTKGLDPNVPMKDSGIEWLGTVPAHWQIGPLKYYTQQKRGAIKTGPFGSQLTSAEMMSGPVKVYNQRNVIDNDFSAGDNYISEEKFSNLVAFETFPGDVLVTTRGTIGRAAILPEGAPQGILHPCLIRIQPDPNLLDKFYLKTLIQDSDLLKIQLSLSSNATTIEVIYSETMASLILPIPPINEQTDIIREIRSIEDKYRKSIWETQKLIELLNERRCALISAAVTGKIDIRNFSIGATDEPA